MAGQEFRLSDQRFEDALSEIHPLLRGECPPAAAPPSPPRRKSKIRKVIAVHSKGLRPALDGFLGVANELGQAKWKKPVEIQLAGLWSLESLNRLDRLEEDARAAEAAAIVGIFESDREVRRFRAAFSGAAPFVRAFTAPEAGDRASVIDFLVELALAVGD